MKTKVRPEFVTEDMLDFLDELRETGVTNMFGAAPYVHDEYPDLNKKESKDVLLYWMETFESRHPE